MLVPYRLPYLLHEAQIEVQVVIAQTPGGEDLSRLVDMA